MKLLMIVYILTGLLFSALAIPLMQKRVGPNPLYGFRVEKTLNDPDIWYAANAYSGTHLFWIGLGIIFISAALYFAPKMNPLTYTLACTLFMLVTLCVSLYMTFRFINRL